ncbi:hypothetical protein Tco_0868966 [Tanacetum coccineum]
MVISIFNIVFSGYMDNEYEKGRIYGIDDVIEINAPYIVSLTIADGLWLSKLLLVDVSCLVKAHLDYDMHGLFEPACEVSHEETLQGLILSLRHVKELKIGESCLEIPTLLKAITKRPRWSYGLMLFQRFRHPLGPKPIYSIGHHSWSSFAHDYVGLRFGHPSFLGPSHQSEMLEASKGRVLSRLEAKGFVFPSNLKVVDATSPLSNDTHSDTIELADASHSDSSESGDSEGIVEQVLGTCCAHNCGQGRKLAGGASTTCSQSQESMYTQNQVDAMFEAQNKMIAAQHRMIQVQSLQFSTLVRALIKSGFPVPDSIVHGNVHEGNEEKDGEDENDK